MTEIARPAHHGPDRSRPANPATNVVVLAVAIFLVIAAVLAIFTFNTQDSLSKIQVSQAEVAAQRQKNTDILCALWEADPPAQRAVVAKTLVAQVQALCGAPVAPSPTPTKG